MRALILSAAMVAAVARAIDKPNVIVYYADHISARELPIYGSSVWSDPVRQDSSDSACRAKTLALDGFAQEKCWIETAWAAYVCNANRAMMMPPPEQTTRS